MVPGIDPKLDIVFKRLFATQANIDLLIDLLNAVLVLPPGRAVTAVEILNPFNDKETLDDKLSILDIKARDQSGRHFNVEMQMEPYHAYPERVLYYLTRLHQQQLHAGEEYHGMEPSFSISFLDHVLFRDQPRWHWRFQLRDVEAPGVVFSDHLTVHVIELPKFDRAAAELATGCERWSYFLRHADELDTDRLPGTLRIPPIQKAMEVLRMLTQDDLEREKYESRLKYQRDQFARLRYAELKGLDRGVLIGRVQSYQEVLKSDPTPEATLLAMSLEQLQELVGQLKEQMAQRGS